MEHEEEIGWESLNGMGAGDLKWYVSDLLMEALKLDHIENDKIRFVIEEGTVSVSGKGGEDLNVYENLYLAICDFYNRIYENEAMAEKAIAHFLTRTLDLPVLMKKPSRSKLLDEISKCEKRIAALEAKSGDMDQKSVTAKKNLDVIYLKGLKDKLEKLK